MCTLFHPATHHPFVFSSRFDLRTAYNPTIASRPFVSQQGANGSESAAVRICTCAFDNALGYVLVPVDINIYYAGAAVFNEIRLSEYVQNIYTYTRMICLQQHANGAGLRVRVTDNIAKVLTSCLQRPGICCRHTCRRLVSGSCLLYTQPRSCTRTRLAGHS